MYVLIKKFSVIIGSQKVTVDNVNHIWTHLNNSIAQSLK